MNSLNVKMLHVFKQHRKKKQSWAVIPSEADFCKSTDLDIKKNPGNSSGHVSYLLAKFCLGELFNFKIKIQGQLHFCLPPLDPQ